MQTHGMELDDRGEVECFTVVEGGVTLERQSPCEFLLVLTLPTGDEVTIVLESRGRIGALVV